jgi:predicted transcriptional regulator
MANPKNKALQLIQNLPEDSTFEDIHYHLYVREKVEKGLRDFEAGRTLTQAQVEEKMAKWLNPLVQCGL